MSGVIVISRPKNQWSNRFRKFDLWLNGECVGKIGAGKSVELTVPSGGFRLCAKIDWCGSPEILGEVEDGAVKKFEVKNGRTLIALFTGKNDKYLDLREI
ncbi:hypothetical protein [Austwickia chelonae]|uniref:hypothetical protein n=1 Tax=Austwickia chelonae TaxID=100225 RepID=UPI000E287C35|nr:hypothetical protein [Austwickia chelonae]